jgi:hypothetical protein
MLATDAQYVRVVARVVDFGAGWYDLDDAFGAAKRLNKPGMSPAYCSEF